MLVLPIINRGRIMHVRVGLKGVKKFHGSVILEGTKESDVIVNQQPFSESSYLYDKEDSSVVNFIRNTSLINHNDFLVTTREESSSKRYDVYQVKQPPKFINPALDNLYASVITDMRKKIPNLERGRYLSLEKLGLGDYLSEEKLSMLRNIVQTEGRSRWLQLFEQAGIADIPQTLEFLNYFDWTVISSTTISEQTIQNCLAAMEPLNTQEYRNLKKYYQMAKSNQEIYSKLSIAYYYSHDQQPYNLIRSGNQDKPDKVTNIGHQKVKSPNEAREVHDHGQAA